ncbi:MAG TPA: hypothetical protein VEP28_04675 [Rubrobacter sp.]|nr:hypothetical protein [Rubrobacter sp.]
MSTRSTKELSLFSYEILGLIGRDGAGAHDLRRMVERGRLLAWAGESQYYVEPKRLAKLGYLDARTEPGRTRQRTVYGLTVKGRAALRDFAASPARMTPLKSEALIRMLIADLVGEAPTSTSIASLREEIASLLIQLEDADAAADALPHRAKYLRLNNSFLRRFLNLHLDWIDEVERELDAAA